MKRLLQTKGLPLAVAAYSAWQAGDLLVAWRHSPLDRLGWLSFLIWAAPAGWALIKQPVRADESPTLCALALLLAIAGQWLDVNALRCGALALALAVFLPASAARGFWLVGAVAWMPLLGWLARDLTLGTMSAVRLALAVAATAPWLLYARKVQPA